MAGPVRLRRRPEGDAAKIALLWRTTRCWSTVVGQTFHGTLAAAPVDQTPKREPPNVAPGTSAAIDLLKERQVAVDFPLHRADGGRAVVLDRSRTTDQALPVRRQGQAQDDPAHLQDGLERLLGRAGVELGGRARARRAATSAATSAAARYELFYNGPHLHMVVLKRKGASYWVVNTPSRPALERDDARDREGPAADRQGPRQLAVGVVR